MSHVISSPSPVYIVYLLWLHLDPLIESQWILVLLPRTNKAVYVFVALRHALIQRSPETWESCCRMTTRPTSQERMELGLKKENEKAPCNSGGHGHADAVATCSTCRKTHFCCHDHGPVIRQRWLFAAKMYFWSWCLSNSRETCCWPDYFCQLPAKVQSRQSILSHPGALTCYSAWCSEGLSHEISTVLIRSSPLA